MRKILAMLLILCLLLAGCGKKDGGKKDKPSKDNTSQSESQVEDSSDIEEIESDDSNFTDETSEAEPGVLTGTVETVESFSNNADTGAFYDTQTGGYDKEAKALREAIRNSDTKYNVTGKTYYISPKGDDFNEGTSPDNAWETLDALVLNSYAIEAGDAILLERGNTYRANSTVSLKTGVIYGAYGKGAKPIINGSARNYADSVLWEPSTKKNIWKMEFAQKDAGIIVFDGGKSYGIKKSGLASMKENGHFYHNVEGKVLYLYCDNGNPGNVYSGMEIGTNQFLFTMNNRVNGVTIDNLCFKYTGAHAIDGFENNYDITIKNCEFGWIGGSMQNTIVRYGNAIQFWDSCWDIRVENNWIYQVYDAGMTFQYKGTKEGSGQYHDITFKDNLIEYCTYGIEIFTEVGTGLQKNITIDSNVIRFSGHGFGNQRPNHVNDAHICAWNKYYGDKVQNFTIKNNVFDCSVSQIIDWASDSLPHTGIAVSGNTFFHKNYKNNPVLHYSTSGYQYASNQSQFEAAIAKFDTTPKKVQWIS